MIVWTHLDLDFLFVGFVRVFHCSHIAKIANFVW